MSQGMRTPTLAPRQLPNLEGWLEEEGSAEGFVCLGHSIQAVKVSVAVPVIEMVSCGVTPALAQRNTPP